eukprot:6200743-Pleurochrysis_carterae.AAC.2
MLAVERGNVDVSCAVSAKGVRCPVCARVGPRKLPPTSVAEMASAARTPCPSVATPVGSDRLRQHPADHCSIPKAWPTASDERVARDAICQQPPRRGAARRLVHFGKFSIDEIWGGDKITASKNVNRRSLIKLARRGDTYEFTTRVYSKGTTV